MSGADRIDEYARSMFAFDRPHAKWVETCARYLTDIFGDRLRGKIFLDYAFGRGNWSLAALKAGAARVVAIDASESNVRNLDAYCRETGVEGIEIVHGNIVEQPLERRADILWIYGVLQHIPKADLFLKRIAAMRANDAAAALVYNYDALSLREAVVTPAREGCLFESERDFADHSFLFTPAARLRARDDLTAPHIAWATQDGLERQVRDAGFFPAKTVPGFAQWSSGKPQREFDPHQLFCTFDAPHPPLPAEAERPNKSDIEIIGELARAVVANAPANLRKTIAIGLLNTHFSPPDATVESQILQDFLFLMHCILRLRLPTDGLRLGRELQDACIKAADGKPRALPPALLQRSSLARYLQDNTVRF